MARAPGSEPGVYLETRNAIYRLATYSSGRDLSFRDVPMTAPVVPDGTVLSFFVVGQRDTTVAAGANIELYFFVVDEADAAFAPEYVSVPVTIRQINPRAHHITAAQLQQVTAQQLPLWGTEMTAFRHYRDVLARTSRSRTTMELMAGLVIRDSADGLARLYAVRLGPPPVGLTFVSRRR